MNVVCVCDTPLQVLNCIQYVKNYIREDKDAVDVFVYHQFKNSEIISENMKKSGIFRNVFDIGLFKEYPGLCQKAATLNRMFFPSRFLKHYVINMETKLERGYDRLVFSFPTTLVFAILSLYKPSEIILLEDGIGTYTSDIADDYSSDSLRIFRKIFKNLNLSISPDYYCVRCPELLDSVDERKKLRLYSSTQFSGVINYIFGYRENDIYKKRKTVFLTQPLNEREGYLTDRYKKLVELLERYHENIVVRQHPRDKSADYSVFMQDTVGNLWELECCNTISDNHILIGGFSTAQLMPKILDGAEPYLIFVYKLFFDSKELSSTFWKSTETFIYKFRDQYKNKNKVFIPETMEEFKAILEKLL